MGIFDIIGPVMIGPSSSHTAGAARIGKIAREILNDEPVSAEITLYGSFATTGKGHGTDKALVAGLMGYAPDSGTIRDAITTAEERGLSVSFQASSTFPLHFDFRHIGMSHIQGRCLKGNQNEGEKWKNGDSGRAVLRRRPCHDYGN